MPPFLASPPEPEPHGQTQRPILEGALEVPVLERAPKTPRVPQLEVQPSQLDAGSGDEPDVTGHQLASKTNPEVLNETVR